jgi:thioredoxin reductase (NADPH)
MSQKKMMIILVLFINVFAGCEKNAQDSVRSDRIEIKTVLNVKDIMPLVIIGSGPAALAAALYGARQGLATLVIAGNKPGGALTETTYVDNWLGRPHILGADLIKEMQAHVVEFGPQFMHDAVQSVDFNTWPFVVKTENGKTINALSVIIATGATPRVLQIPGEKEYWGKGVTTCAICDAPYYKGKDVVVVGGGDSALEEAMQLAPYAEKITVLVRKDTLRAAPTMQERLKEYPHIHVQFNVEVKKINGNGSHVTSIELYNSATNSTELINISGLFLAIGHEPTTKIFNNQLALDQYGYIVMADRTQKTSVPGVFAAGDVEDSRYRQAFVASGHGVSAALDAASFLQEHGFTTEVAKTIKPNLFNANAVQEGVLKVDNIALPKDFQRVLDETDGLVVLDFYAPYCPSCMRMLPMIESVAYQFSGKVLFLKVDTSKTTELADMYKVLSVPCLLVFKDGQLAARYTKALSRKELVEIMQKLL